MTNDAHNRGQDSRRTVLAFAGLLAVALVVYSQTLAFAWDEGFHLLTAQLIKAGQRPYLDFLFPQPPLNAYWVAWWMRVFGESWHTAQALSALESAGAIALVADFLLRSFPVARWRTEAALTAILLFGLNTMVVEFGTEGQAYGLCLLCAIAAFRFAISEHPFAAGFFAGAAACASLLTAPIAPVLFVWMLWHANRKLPVLAAFTIGVTIPWLPVIWLFAKAPSIVWFGLAGYNILYRRNGWGDPTDHDIGVLTAWIDSVQALTLGLLAIAGLLFIIRKSGWDARARAPFILCAWLALAQFAHLALGRPTFERYYLLTVPFLAVLAAAGVYSIATRLANPNRPGLAVAFVGILMALSLGKALYAERDAFLWSDVEEIARKAEQVTPRNGTLLADEHIYFLTGRRPPSGMELDYSHRLLIPPEFAAALHVVLRPELNRRIHAGTYDTIATCEEEKAAAIGIPELYRQKANIADCTVYWDFKR